MDEYLASPPKDAPRLKERNYQGVNEVLPYTNDLLVEYANNLYSNITISEKFDNVDIDRNGTGPLEHTFGRARVKSKDVHTINKFISTIGDMNYQSLKSVCYEVEQIRGRSLNFGVIMENKDESELLFLSTPQQIAFEMLNFIDIKVSEDIPTNYEYLFLFIEYLNEFVDEEQLKTLTVNTITLRTQQTKTIKQRMAFTVAKENEQLMNFFKSFDSSQKIKKDFLLMFYKELKHNVPLFPSIQNKNPTKRILIDHLQNNFYAYKRDYSDLMKFIKSEKK